MNQTFKHLAIFLTFLATLLVWFAAGNWLRREFFRFHHGTTVHLLFWASCVVVIFHLLFHYMGKLTEKGIYMSSLLVVVITSCLVYFGELPMP